VTFRLTEDNPADSLDSLRGSNRGTAKFQDFQQRLRHGEIVADPQGSRDTLLTLLDIDVDKDLWWTRQVNRDAAHTLEVIQSYYRARLEAAGIGTAEGVQGLRAGALRQCPPEDSVGDCVPHS
jgi:hypothetical protein